jgi:ABC-type sugar transport system permease subunit
MKSTLGNYGNRRKLAGFLFVLPVVLYFALLYYLPLVTSLQYSFLEVLPKQQTRFAGLSPVCRPIGGFSLIPCSGRV